MTNETETATQAAVTYPSVFDASGYLFQDVDFELVQVAHGQAWDCSRRVAPLGIPAEEFPHFRESLLFALSDNGLLDADVRIQGSSAHFMSGLHKIFPPTRANRVSTFLKEHRRMPNSLESEQLEKKIRETWEGTLPRQRFFDTLFALGISPECSDIDIQISSDLAWAHAEKIALRLNLPPGSISFNNPSYGFLMKEIADSEFLYLNRWKTYWTDRLNRDVAIAIFDGDGPPPAKGLVSSHFKESDWVIVGNQIEVES